MKKLFSLLLAGVMLLSLAACGSSTQSAESSSASKNITSAEDTEAVQNNEAKEDDASAEETEETETTSESASNALVVYFSLAGEQYSVGTIDEGNTAIIAKMIAEETGADLFSIEPVEAYPDDYDGKLTVAREEQNSNARPEITNTVENWDDYDTVFIGYPIWWGNLPNILYTFMESYDFSGKTVIPFCTHAGSGLSGTESDIADAAGAEMKEGLAVAGTTAQNDRDAALTAVQSWLEEVYPFR